MKMGKRFKSAEQFGAAIGLSDLDMEMIRQKKELIEKLQKARIKKGITRCSGVLPREKHREI